MCSNRWSAAAWAMLAAAVVAGGASSPAFAADGPAKHAPVTDEWKFKFAPYLWLPSVDGDVTVRDRTITSEQDTEDVVNLLETSLEFAFAGRFEVEKGPIGLFADVMYVDFGSESETRRGRTVEAGADMFIGELGVFYTLVRPDAAAKHPFRLDVLGGARVTAFGIDAEVDGGGPSLDRDVDWVDPFVGVRAEVGLLEWLSLKGRADVGGFGIGGDGDTSDLVWNAEVAASFKLAKWMHVDVGYRALDYDYEDGSGNDRFEFDATLHGPFVAFEFRF